MKIKKIAAALMIVMLLCTAAIAVEQQSAAPDTRLNQKVTYQAKGQPLYKVLGELTGMTKVKMTCGKNDKDWQVRDRKVTIFIKDMPLKDLQRNLAGVLHFTWGKGQDKTDNAYTYRLFQDLKQRKEEDGLRDQATAEAQKKTAERCKSTVADMDKLDSLSPEEVEKLKDKSPYLYFLAKDPMGQGLRQMIKSIPGMRAAIADGRELTTSFSEQSPKAAEAARSFIEGYESMDKRYGSEQSYQGLSDHIYDAKIRLISAPEGPTSAAMLGYIDITAPGQPFARTPIFDPQSPVADLMARIITKLNEGMTMSQLMPQIDKDFEKINLERIKQENPVEPLPDNPALSTKIKLESAKALALPDVIEEICNLSDLQIISDHFEKYKLPLNIDGEKKLSEVLQEISVMFGKKVKSNGSLIVLEDRKWFIKRSWEVPEAWLDMWTNRAEKTGLSFDDAAQIASLTDDQLTNTIRKDETLGPISASIISNQYILRLYAVLTQPQKIALVSKTGLDMSTLSEEQWPYFTAVVSKLDPNKADYNTRFVMFKEDNKAARWSTIRLEGTPIDPESNESTSVLKTWTIHLHEPRPKPEQKAGTPAVK